MHVVVYRYFVPSEHTKSLLRVHRNVRGIYQKSGCVRYELYRKPETGEWLEVNCFKDKASYERSLKTIDSNRRIASLFKQFKRIVEGGIERVNRTELAEGNEKTLEKITSGFEILRL